MKNRNTSISTALACTLVVLASCESAPPKEPPQPCTTPEDENAPADVTITVKDASLDLGGGSSFEAWTFDGNVPGPVLRMTVGQTKRIKLVNASERATSLHFHGVKYAADDDGTPEHPRSIVYPSCAHVYTITADAPGAWVYHSHVDPRVELSKGLYGAVIVAEPNEPAADHDYVVFMGQLGLEGEKEEEEGEAEPFFMTINGRPNGHAMVIERKGDAYAMSEGRARARVGNRVRWHVLSVAPDDAHTFHIHGHRWCDRGGLVDQTGRCPNGGVVADNVSLLPAQGVTFEYVEDAPGTWMMHCHILDHVTDGMWAMYDVE